MIFEISEGLTETVLILTNVSDTQIWIQNEYDDAFNEVDIQSKHSDDVEMMMKKLLIEKKKESILWS